MKPVFRVLIVNYYGSEPSNPGGKRTLLWKSFFHEHNVTICSPKEIGQTGIVNKLLSRLKNFIYGRYPVPDLDWIKDVESKISSEDYDYVILCCPHYYVCKFICDTKHTKIIVDVRDGIYFESLWSGLEKWRYKKQLSEFEQNLNDAFLVTSNIPGLKRHYEELLSKPVCLLLNSSIFTEQSYLIKSERTEDTIKLLYTGGLFRSSIGQNLISLCRAIKNHNSKTNHKKFSLTMIGRFNIIEKMLYTKLFGFVFILDEVPAKDLEEISKDYDVFVIANTTSRDLLPSKFWFYYKSDMPILSINPSYSLKYVSEKVPGMLNTENSSADIMVALEQLNGIERVDRRNITIGDEKLAIENRLSLN